MLSPMPDRLVGRERELQAITRFLDAAAMGPAALVLEGDPGIGKTALWRAAVASASRDRRVLVCRAVEAETGYAFAGLGDLLGPFVDEAAGSMAEPLARALDAALLRGGGTAATPRAVGMATAAALTRLAEVGPLLVAVDDAQWLDGPTADALRFAVRRLADASVGIVVTRRAVDRGAMPAPFGLDGLDPPPVRLEVAPMNVRQLHRLLTDALDEAPTRPELVRIAELSGGNPLYALELARARTSGHHVAGVPDAVPAALRQMFGDRIARLDPAARWALLLVGTSRRARADALRGLPDVAAGLEVAERERLIELDDGAARFVHPLIGRAVYAEAARADRRRAHRLMAEHSIDPEERARHLALAEDRPDATVAAALATAAHAAAHRGAPETAAELLELAVERSPADDPARRGTELALARRRFQTGDTESAHALASFLGASGTDHVAAAALVLLAEIEHEAGRSAAGVAFCERALALVPDDPALRATILATAAIVGYDDLPAAAVRAEEAIAQIALIADPDPDIEATALQAIVHIDLLLGRGFRSADFARATRLAGDRWTERVADRPASILGAFLAWIDDLVGARTALEATRRAAVEEGDDSSLPYALSHLTRVEHRAGNLRLAHDLAEECLELAIGLRQHFQHCQALAQIGWIDAELGEVDAGRAAGSESLAMARAEGDAWAVRLALTALGHIELLAHRPVAAADVLTEAEAIGDASGLADPGQRRDRLALAEALIAIGDLGGAERRISVHRGTAVRLDRPAAVARADRTTALLLAAQGALDDAAGAASAAVAGYDRAPIPFEAAQAWVTLGQIERRRRRKAAARHALARAVEGFGTIGAARAADEAASELRRIGTRTSAGALTESERRVAELVAAGRTNREAAAALFMSEKTVEANLSRIYAKLGVRGRTELAARATVRGFG
jgi:DNA-binding NarL/FixJ family response regulator